MLIEVKFGVNGIKQTMAIALWKVDCYKRKKVWQDCDKGEHHGDHVLGAIKLWVISKTKLRVSWRKIMRIKVEPKWTSC